MIVLVLTPFLTAPALSLVLVPLVRLISRRLEIGPS